MNNKIDYSGEAKKYLENKYNQDFSLVEVIYPSVDIPYAEILFQSERYPNETIIVCRESGTFSDNYYGIMARDVCRTKISFILNKYFEENKFTFNFGASYFPDEATDIDKFDEYRVKYPYHFDVNVHVLVRRSDAINEELFNDVCSDFESNKYCGYIALYEISSEEYDRLDSQNSIDQYVDDYPTIPPFNKVLK